MMWVESQQLTSAKNLYLAKRNYFFQTIVMSHLWHILLNCYHSNRSYTNRNTETEIVQPQLTADLYLKYYISNHRFGIVL